MEIAYSGVILVQPAYENLVKLFNDTFPSKSDWRIYAHHMTLNLGPLNPAFGKIADQVRLKVLKIGTNSKAAAVLVEPTDYFKQANITAMKCGIKMPHVTLAVNPDGGKPVMSNDITVWNDIDVTKYLEWAFPEDHCLYLDGVISEVEKK
jgi:hypothetical protein